LLTPSSPGVFQICLWPLIAPGYLGESCHASHQASDASSPLCIVFSLWQLSVTFSTYLTCDQHVASSTVLSGASLGKLFTHTHVPLSSSSSNLVPAQAGRGTVGLASHWPCVSDNNGNSTYRLTAYVREMRIPSTLQLEQGNFTLTCWMAFETRHMSLWVIVITAVWILVRLLCTDWLHSPSEWPLTVVLSLLLPCASPAVVRIDTLRFLAGCRKRRLNQALSVLSLSLGFFWCICCGH